MGRIGQRGRPALSVKMDSAEIERQHLGGESWRDLARSLSVSVGWLRNHLKRLERYTRRPAQTPAERSRRYREKRGLAAAEARVINEIFGASSSQP